MGNKTILILAAHPDDTEFMAGGTIAKFVKDGYEVIEVIATNGERGSFEYGPGELIEIREKEAKEAARALGKKDVIFLRYSDGYLGDIPIIMLREQFIRLIRRFKPSIVFTWDHWAPFEPHPDHRIVAQAVMEALSFSHFPLFYPEHIDEGLKPHLVLERYYFAKENKLCDTVVDITDFVDAKIQSLYAHDSQLRQMIDDLILTLKALDATGEMPAKVDRDNYRGLVELMIKALNGRIGSKAGYAFGEEFRYETAGGPVAEAAMSMLK